MLDPWRKENCFGANDELILPNRKIPAHSRCIRTKSFHVLPRRFVNATCGRVTATRPHRLHSILCPSVHKCLQGNMLAGLRITENCPKHHFGLDKWISWSSSPFTSINSFSQALCGFSLHRRPSLSSGPWFFQGQTSVRKIPNLQNSSTTFTDRKAIRKAWCFTKLLQFVPFCPQFVVHSVLHPTLGSIN